MFPYFLLLSLPVFLGLFYQHRRPTWLALFPVLLIFVVFIGFRERIGMDWNNYMAKFEGYELLSLPEILIEADPLFALLNWVVIKLGFGLYGVNFICALIFCIGLFAYAKRTMSPWLAIAAVTPYLVVVIGMSAIRQAAAIGIFLFLLASWERRSAVFKLIGIAFAIGLHSSAVFFLIFMLNISGSTKRKVFLLISILIVGVLVASSSEQANFYSDYYSSVYISDNLVSTGAFMHMMLNFVPATLYFIYRKRWIQRYGADENLALLALLSILIMPMIMVSSTGTDRLALYFSGVQMAVYAGLPALFHGRTAFIIRLIIGLVVFFMLFFWLSFGNSRVAYIPFRSIIFGG